MCYNQRQIGKHLAGQSSTPSMTTPQKSTKMFHYYKPLDNQFSKLLGVMEKMVTRPQGGPTQQNWPYRPYIHRGRGYDHRNHPTHGRGQGNFRLRSYVPTRGGYFP